jgi:hypothetical protein
MSENQAEYITEATGLMGWDKLPPRQIITEVSGFTPIFDVLIEHHKDLVRAAVHGAMWRFCQMQDGVCKASLETIGASIGVSSATAMRHADELVKDGYFEDLTPDLRNRPHIYRDMGRVAIRSKFDAHISQRNTGISQRNTGISQSQLNKDSIKESNKDSFSPAASQPDGVDLELAKLGPKALREAYRDYFRLTPNWETKSASQFMRWSLEEGITPEQIKAGADIWGSDKRFNWSHPTLKSIQEQWYRLMDAVTEAQQNVIPCYED